MLPANLYSQGLISLVYLQSHEHLLCVDGSLGREAFLWNSVFSIMAGRRDVRAAENEDRCEAGQMRAQLPS